LDARRRTDNAQSSQGRAASLFRRTKSCAITGRYLPIHRPVLLNLGQGVAWDNWIGRGVRRNHPEDYPEYVKGCDIVSFDIYPAVHDKAEVAGKLEFVARGVERLGQWTRGEKIIWNCIEASRISNPQVKPTPDQVRAEVWMALIHGSRGLIYFVHQFKPTFKGPRCSTTRNCCLPLPPSTGDSRTGSRAQQPEHRGRR
jgi:hypothetical protein